MRTSRTSLLVLGALLGSSACSEDFDTTRRAPERASLGQELYTVVCDRVGAGAIPEDLSGASYRRVCHADGAGAFADTVDESLLPPPESLPSAEQRLRAQAARRSAVAKLSALAARRADLIAAFDATFDDEEVAVPFDAARTIRGHAALSAFLKSLVPLYESNPIVPGDEPSFPAVTRASGRLFAGLGGPGDDPISAVTDAAKALAAQESLSRLSGRQGYRPLRLALGVLRPTLSYPDLRGFAQVLGPRVRPGGPYRVAFQNLLGNTENELATSVPGAAPTALVVDGARAQPNRPRSNSEVAAFALLAQHEAFRPAGSSPRFIVKRDSRSYALPAGVVPGDGATITAPLTDGDGDGLPDVDALGRFLSADGSLAPLPSPFPVAGLPDSSPRDAFGRAQVGGGLAWQYVDTSAVLVQALARNLEPLIDPDGGVEAVADLVGGIHLLSGDRVSVAAPWAADGQWEGFDAATSPLPDLLHAMGPVLAHRKSDVTLAMVEKLFTEHEPLMARVVSAALRVRELSNAHPEARLDPTNPFWDDLGDVVVRLLQNPALFKDVLRAMKDPRVNFVLSQAFGKFVQFRDRVTYNPNDLNGPVVNLTVGGGSTQPPSTPVDRALPDALLPDGTENRSGFHRILQMIHDMDRVNSCNRRGAKVRVKLGPLDLSWPLIGSYDECEVLRIPDIGLVYLDSVLDEVYQRNPRQARLEIQDAVLSGLTGLLGGLGSVDQLFEQSSGITGLSLTPSPRAFHRLVYFGTTSVKYDAFFGGQMPDRDPYVGGRNQLTEQFIGSLIDPLATSLCPARQVAGLALQDCAADTTATFPDGSKATPFDLLRVRDPGGIFLWEHFDFLNGVAPLAMAFDSHDEGQLFLDLLQVLYRHWPSELHGAECNTAGSWDHTAPNFNPRFCYESGLSRYEPILKEVFEGDLLPALGDLLTVLDNPAFITDVRGGGQAQNGLDLVHEVAVALMDPAWSSAHQVTDRRGNASTTWVDGSRPKPQLTPFDLLGEATRGMDQRLAADPAVWDRWKAARSRLVDTFLGAQGSGPSARFTNPATPRAIPVLVRALREQLNANCPDREVTDSCPWARVELGRKSAETFGGPSYGTAMVLLDLMDRDPEARAALQRLLRHLLRQATDAEATTLTSISDLLQILSDDRNMPAIYNAVALAAAPEGGALGPGAGDRAVSLIDALTREVNDAGDPAPNPYDRYHSLDRILANIVTPLDPDDPASPAPLEILLDTIAEVNREDAAAPRDQPPSPRDFALVFGTLRDFMTDETRGLEQFYEIVSHRNGN